MALNEEVRMSWEDMADGVALAHRSRTGRRAHANGLAPLVARDVQAVMSDGWLPNPEDLAEGVVFDGLDELRVEHRRFTTQVAELRHELDLLRHKFDGEDQGWEQLLRDAYRAGKKPPASDPRTPEDERARRRGELEERLRAAQLTAIEWSQRALIALRESAPVWLGAIAESQQPLRDELEQLNDRIDQIKDELRADDCLRLWLDRTLQGIPGNHMPFARQPMFDGPAEPDVRGPYAEIAHRQAMAARGLTPTSRGGTAA
jgi:hypothetical protein